ncbi:hypothetical protein ACZ90_11475 [Streptomyces albus subsp. albus]|nr:hypothetical protein ACZ90_11475 [Streptomyces albus subsp. albus]
MPDTSGTGTGATGAPGHLSSNVADKLKEILSRLEAADDDIGDKGAIELSLQEADAMWEVAYKTGIPLVE